jgi:hypothetical protein
MEMENMTYQELQELRYDLINGYFYYLENIEEIYNIDIILDDIREELKEVEKYMELRKN